MKALTHFSRIAAVIFVTFLHGQVQVDPRNAGERLICIVPMVGAGTYDDPKRPLLAPKPSEVAADGSGIVSFRFEVSDDGKTALVELIATNRAALKPILQTTRGDVRIFEKGKATKEEITTAFRPHKKDFDADKFEAERK